jgi:peptidase E
MVLRSTARVALSVRNPRGIIRAAMNNSHCASAAVASAPPSALGTLITIGGGGFSTATEPELDVYVLQQSPEVCPRIGFICTASGDADHYLVKFYQRFTALDCRASHLPLFLRTPDLAAWVRAQDVIYVGGGNTKSMLAVWRAWGLPELLAGALARGTVLAGVSAGAICWFEQGLTDSDAHGLQALDCLGWLAGSCTPHYSNEPERRQAYARLLSAGLMIPGLGIDDGAAVHFQHGRPHRLVLGNARAGAHRISRTPEGILEEALEIDTLRL